MRTIGIAASLILLFLSGSALGQERTAPPERSSPEATLRTFIGALNPPDGEPHRPADAAACMDFSMVNFRVVSRATQARKLKRVLDLTERIDFDSVRTPPDGEPYIIPTPELASGPILLVKKPESGEWLFSAQTVAAVDDMLAEATELGLTLKAGGEAVPFSESPAMWLRSKMPESFTRQTFFLERWQWVALLLLCILGILLERIVAVVIPTVFRLRLRKKQAVEVDAQVARTGFRPFAILAMALFWWAFIDWVGLPANIAAIVVVAIRFLAALAGVWAAYRLVDLAADVLAEKARGTKTKFDDLLIPLFRKSLKVFITVIGMVFIASVLDINVTSVLAGLGLGGLAFALAAKDTVQNLFGSMTVILDRPFQVGDWVRIGDTEGTVEEVGFRSTRVRTFYNSRITVPNGTLISAVVDNMGARRYRRAKITLGLTYDTPAEKIEAFCEGVRELIRVHPYTRKDYFHVYFNTFSGSSLDVLLYTFFEVPDWGTELRKRQRLFLDILRLAARLGVEFAFPTQTLHVAPPAEGEPETPALPRAPEVETALEAGRREARDIVKGTLGDPPIRPDPVQITPAKWENRGESGEDDGGGDGE